MQTRNSDGTYKLNWNHPQTAPTKKNLVPWYLLSRNVLFINGVLKNVGTESYNKFTKRCMALEPAECETMNFFCLGCKPVSTDHVLSALFSNEFMAKVKGEITQ
jgi:hypothetical protein